MTTPISNSADGLPGAPERGVDLEAVRRIAAPVVQAHGLALWDVEWAGTMAGWVLRVYIERPEGQAGAVGLPGGPSPGGPAPGGVTLDDCVRVSRDLSTALDAADPIALRYNLEVSSPGLDRPLRNAGDYARQLGRLAKLKLAQPQSDGQMVLRGVILAVDPDGRSVRMEVDGKEHQVDLGNVRQAKLVFELDGVPKGARKGAGARTGAKKKGSKKNRRQAPAQGPVGQRNS